MTGGGTGIGRATALDLARCGADVVICGRRPEPLEKTLAEVEAMGARALAVPADIRDEDQVHHLIDAALRTVRPDRHPGQQRGRTVQRPRRADHQQGLAGGAPTWQSTRPGR